MQPVPTIDLGGLEISRFIIGGNPFSGFSHQSKARSQEMLDWYTDERIVETLFQAEALGLNACLCRGDDHITRVLERYWEEGGTMRWIAQTDSHAETSAAGASYCVDHGASACYAHGGIVDHDVAQGDYQDIYDFVETLKDAQVPAGLAGHMPQDFIWAEEHVDVDFYMVCHYNPSPRQSVPHHDPAATEAYLEEDRQERVATIQALQKPVIHYKVLAAGRNDPADAFAYTASKMRPVDAVCVGIFTKEDPHMLEEDVRIFLESLRAVGQCSA